ncbi:MAG TPA: hypothetical protein VHE57_14475, partial [Mycobacteriales bacterium]|nr:hypothetical protein [Mycobacteriales bacterium]
MGALALPFLAVTAAAHHPAHHAPERLPAAAVFTVAPNGSGEACTPADPCSLATAQSQARVLEKDSRYGVAVELQGGTYHLSHPVRLTTADSGRPGAEVVYRAADGAHPVLSGGKRITGWQPVKGSKNFYVDIPKGFDTRQLYVDGRRQQLARGTGGGRMVQTDTGLIASNA